jgi:hypothetical protein
VIVEVEHDLHLRPLQPLARV